MIPEPPTRILLVLDEKEDVMKRRLYSERAASMLMKRKNEAFAGSQFRFRDIGRISNRAPSVRDSIPMTLSQPRRRQRLFMNSVRCRCSSRQGRRRLVEDEQRSGLDGFVEPWKC